PRPSSRFPDIPGRAERAVLGSFKALKSCIYPPRNWMNRGCSVLCLCKLLKTLEFPACQSSKQWTLACFRIVVFVCRFIQGHEAEPASQSWGGGAGASYAGSGNFCPVEF